MIGNMTPFCTKESFVNIVDTLLRIYKDKTRISLIPVKGSEISFKKKCHSNLLHIYKLLVSVCRDLPRFWIRYPESYVTEIVKSMIELASYSENRQRSRGPNYLMPSDFLSLVDPQALWLQSWLHGEFGRSITFNEIRQTNVLFRLAVQNVNFSMDIQKTSPILVARGSSKGKGILTVSFQAYANFVYNLNVLSLLLMHKKGLDLLSNLQDESPVSLDGIVATLTSSVCHSIERSSQNSAAIITRCLVKLLSKDHVVQSLIGQKQFFKTLIFPLILWEEELKTKRREALPGSGKLSRSFNIASTFLSIAKVLKLYGVSLFE